MLYRQCQNTFRPQGHLSDSCGIRKFFNTCTHLPCQNTHNLNWVYIWIWVWTILLSNCCFLKNLRWKTYGGQLDCPEFQTQSWLPHRAMFRIKLSGPYQNPILSTGGMTLVWGPLLLWISNTVLILSMSGGHPTLLRWWKHTIYL